VLAALAFCACGPSIGDDDDSTPPVEGRVTVQPGGLIFDTIQEAIDAAAEGATITVSAGVYEESLDINKALTLSGENSAATLVTGAGGGTIVQIDQASGPVQINGLALVAPADEPGTIRGMRITESADVLLHDLLLGFDDRGASGECVHGLVGIEVSSSVVTISETDIYCVGFSSDTGGAGILSQTSSDLTVVDSSIGAVGSFGIRSLTSALTLSDTSISSVNRPPSAEQYESDGTAVFIEQTTQEVVLDRVSISGGSFVGVWMEGPTLTVTDSEFSSFPYGVYLPGDSAIASGRQLTVTGSSFSDIMQEAILSVASSTVTGSTFRTNGLLVDPNTGPAYSGVRVIAPQGDVVVTGNVFENLGVRGVTAVGNNDGNVANVTVSYNTVTGIAAGNGLLISDADNVVMEENIIADIDHAYFDDAGGSGAGSITNGFGMACFRVTSCTLSGNDVSGAEFANMVIVTSNFSSTNDVLHDGLGRGLQAESSQGTITNGTFEDNRGVGLVMISSTVQGTGGVFRRTLRGPSFLDVDGVDDPPPEEMTYLQGGRAIESLASGGNAFLSWSDGVFEDNIAGAVYSSGGQIEFTNNRLTMNGYDDVETGMSGGAAIVVSGADELALSGPLIDGNIVDGCGGAWAVSVSQAPGARVQNNTVCGGTTAGIYMTRSDGALVAGNSLGSSSDASVSHCDDIDWTYALYLNQTDLAEVVAGVTISDNEITPAQASYGMYISGVGAYQIEDNHVVGGTTAGISASLSLPSGMTWDDDNDGQAEYQGDCDDTNAAVGGAGAIEIPDDGLDNDCDGVTDDGLSATDNDADGHSIADGDCNDGNAAVFPGAVEVVGNFYDDNCDGWAEFDGPFPAPTLTLEGNLIEDSSDGIRLHGATLLMPAAEAGEPVNRVTGATAEGMYLSTWTWSGTPASVPATATIGADHVIENTGSSCVHLAGIGTSLQVDGVTLGQCGHWGVYLSADGTVNATDVFVDEPGFSGIRTLAGVATIDGFEVDSPGNSGFEFLGGSFAGSNLEVNDAGANAVYLGGAVGTVDGLVANFMADAGVNAISGIMTLSNSSVGGAVGAGARVTGAELSLIGGSISSSGLAGVDASAGALVVNGTTIENNSGDGIQLSGAVTATVVDAVLSGNGAYGLSCDGDLGDLATSSVHLVACSSQSAGNASGDFSQFNGCELDVTCSLTPSGN